jgi:hypothetical protein
MSSTSSAAIEAGLQSRGTGLAAAWREGRRRTVVATGIAVVIVTASLAYYGICMFPGIGGELNAGESAQFQILGYTAIMVHGPGYPLVLLLFSGLRALHLPFAPWWTVTFALSVVPAAFSNALAFAIVLRLTGSLLMGIAGALLLASSGLMAIEATEAGVYALTLLFVLSTSFLLIVYLDTKRQAYFVAACAVYTLSFGNHLMMIFMLPVLVWVAAANHRQVLRPQPVALITAFILLAAGQYLYLAYVAYDPSTSYSEYMRLPPGPVTLIHYIMGAHFSDLFGSGLRSTRTWNEFIGTLQSAQPWLSLPLIIIGILLLAAGWRRRDAAWQGIALLYGTGLAFSAFVLWYGGLDIREHLPALATLLTGSLCAVGWWLKGRPFTVGPVAVALIAVGLGRTDQIGVLLTARTPMFAGLPQAMNQMVAQAPVKSPLVAMSYPLRMATLYYQLQGQVAPATYRLYWPAIAEVRDQNEIGGIVVPTDGLQFVQWIKNRRPDLVCTTTTITTSGDTRWPAYGFKCVAGPLASPVQSPR